jgi:mono/diheme cytochrome c family protein
MAATDKFHRNQTTLDIVFAVSSILMLFSIIWMFVQDFNREYKVEQRNFRDVEVAVAERAALSKLPDYRTYQAVLRKVEEEKEIKSGKAEDLAKLKQQIMDMLPGKEKAEAKYQGIKAELDSRSSFYDIAVEKYGPNDARTLGYRSEIEDIKSRLDGARAEVDSFHANLRDLQQKQDDIERPLTKAMGELTKMNADFDLQVRLSMQKQWGFSDWFRSIPVIDGFAAPVKIHQFTLPELTINYNFKQVTRFDRCMTCHLGIERGSFVADRLLTMREPTKEQTEEVEQALMLLARIDRFVNSERPKKDRVFVRAGDIFGAGPDENAVQRLLTDKEAGAERATIADNLEKKRKEILRSSHWSPHLLRVVEEEQDLDQARRMLAQRKEALQGLPEGKAVQSAKQFELRHLSPESLTASRIREFAAHPRLDLFVGSNSKHPAEKFGCTVCHNGQGSGTSFMWASHSPNDPHTAHRWRGEYGWSRNHDWDFPMSSRRFLESSCIKCHHQVTDLADTARWTDVRPEIVSKGEGHGHAELFAKNVDTPAPGATVVRGYNLIRQNGCFGCHEISGVKNGRFVGPDLRLEPNPPLESLTPAERAKATSDPLNPPGAFRKVGPSLYRLSEKSNEEWTEKWVRAPREFRPDTKMPHFYGLSNNDESVLPKNNDEKSKFLKQHFPDTEIHAITYVLFKSSRDYLKNVQELQKKDTPANRETDQKALDALSEKTRPTNEEKAKLDELTQRMQLREAALPIADASRALHLAKDYKEDTVRGRQLFSERGCLACHHHDGTEQPFGTKGAKDKDGKPLPFVPALHSDAQFGPDLSQVVGKLGTKPGDATSAKLWLVNWLKNPNLHSPRTTMPITHLEDDEASDIAAWLLSQGVKGTDPKWNDLKVKEPTLEQLEELANVYLERLLSKSDREKLRKEGKLPNDRVNDLPADEKEMLLTNEKTGKNGYNPDGLKWYLGKKAIGRQGCYACHSIPGFETAKPIGVALNDWGAKAVDRLAFEDIEHFVEEKYHVVDEPFNPKDKETAKARKEQAEDNKQLYEKFFFHGLEPGHQTREAYLNQKLMEPRSYDYNRQRAWDDLARMPQFKFARVRRQPGESDEAYHLRSEKEETEAREAVMTFVLGLTAESIPGDYLPRPDLDRTAEVQGLKVIQKFNCDGCHQLKPGGYELDLTRQMAKQLEAGYKLSQSTEKSDFNFLNHAAWAGRLPAKGQSMTAYGIPTVLEDPDEGKKINTLRLVDSLRFQNGANGDSRAHDIRATSTIVIPDNAVQAKSEVYGGAFGENLAKYLQAKDAEMFKDNYAKASSPPTLYFEGERVQSAWLYKFLLNPTPIRPMVVLKVMPKFNMSQDDARLLVNYFGAVEKRKNPGIGLTYPYLDAPQTDAEYGRHKTQEYVTRLKKNEKLYKARVAELHAIWERQAKDELSRGEENVKEMEASINALRESEKAEKDDAKKKEKATAVKQAVEQKQTLEAHLKQLRQLTSDAKAREEYQSKLLAQWEREDAYWTDGFRLVANTNICLSCHQVGIYPAAKPRGEQGPPLALAAERLRPEWMKRWIANPQRYLVYPSAMPQNFPADKNGEDWYPYFYGDSLQQATAARDVLFNLPRVADIPANRYWQGSGSAGGKQP